MLEDKILEDYRQALKQKDQIKASTLSFLRSQLKDYAIKLRKEKLEDADCLAVIKRQVKRHKESIEQFQRGNRLELAESEKRQLEIIESYLPRQLSQEELKSLISQAIEETGARDPKDVGRVMKELMQKASGSIDGKLANQLARELLGEGPQFRK
jgi:hypothetical protein